ncbi:MAG TPA: helix-hairpin-helix domain-containing protein [Thermomicrobiales bacterium]|nr:helix-hairpin-helix domain-containing protein [Thermomicrobiales bacterium]
MAPAGPPPSNGEIAALLREFADLLELRGESPFRTRAYRHAADQLGALDRPAAALSPADLQAIEGVGKGIAATVAEIAARGSFGALDELRAGTPASVMRFTDIPGVGVKTAARLYETLGVATLADLERAAAAGRIRAAQGLGPRVEKTVTEGLAQLAAGAGRHSIGVAWPLGALLAELLGAAAGCPVALAGSTRRLRESVGDLDLLAASAEPARVLAAFAALPPVVRVLERGEDALAAELDRGLVARLTVVAPGRFGTELVRRTGSAAHLDALRALAGGDPFAAPHATEEAFYTALGLPPIPPELREGRGEVAAARAGALPALLALDDLRGDLHAHSVWSDGAATIEEMARAAIARGYAYLSVSDHTKSLGVANGLDAARLREQWREIARLNAELAPFRLLKSAEVEILRDGALDLPNAVLAELDVVVASLHTGLRGDRETVTGRLVRAIRNPHVDIIAHPSGRIVGGRAGADYDWETVYREAAATGTVLEINGSTERLDLSDEHARAARERGVLLAIDSDAHQTGGLATIFFGVATARRAWTTAADVLNTRPLGDLLARLKP